MKNKGRRHKGRREAPYIIRKGTYNGIISTMNNYMNTAASLYSTAIEWIIRHIAVVYLVELTGIVVLCLYGVISENGFGASGY